MSDNGQSNATVVRTSRGLTVGGSRLTIYQLMDHFKAGDTDELVQEWYRLTPQQVADVHGYIAVHREEVEREYQDVLRRAEEDRQYWERRNREHLDRIQDLPLTPEQSARQAKLEELRSRRNRA